MNEKEALYKKNQRRIKVVSILTPIVFWVLIALSLVCFFTAIQQSLDNVNEIYDMLDSKVYNDTEIADNYNYLIDKYGEMVIGQGGGGFTLHFVNFKGAIFNAVIFSLVVVAEVSFVLAFLLGKWLLPFLKNKWEHDNQDMVNLTILRKD